MKKAILCLLILFFGSIGFGQANSKLDSLKRILAKLPVEGKSFASDTLRVKVLCEVLESEPFTSSQNYFFEAINISKRVNWIYGIALSYHKYGIKSTINGNLFNAIDFLNLSLINSEKIGDLELTANNLRYTGHGSG